MNGPQPGDKRGKIEDARWSRCKAALSMGTAMGTEIERKFLIRDESWRATAADSRRLRQGYLAIDGQTTVRVRTDGEEAWVTIKGPQVGLARAEFEYRIPCEDAEGLLGLCRGRVVEKVRYRVPFGRHVWEIDEFSGANAGLVVAEIELDRADEPFERPEWLGDEVSSDPRYLNANLSSKPYGSWAAGNS
ncbi:MAG: CYTH domain-containing protein [Chthoniobacterales bacterium]